MHAGTTIVTGLPLWYVLTAMLHCALRPRVHLPGPPLSCTCSGTPYAGGGGTCRRGLQRDDPKGHGPGRWGRGADTGNGHGETKTNFFLFPFLTDYFTV